MDSIGERIKKRRLELNMSLDQLAKKLGVNKSTIFRYETGEIEKLPVYMLNPILSALNCTPSYLLGSEVFENESSSIGIFDNSIYDYSNIRERLKSLRKENGYTLSYIADYLGVTEATAQRYESGNGIKNISLDIIIKYSELFHCSPQYIAGWNILEPRFKYYKAYEIIENYNLSESQMLQVLNFASYIKSHELLKEDLYGCK